MVAAAGAGRAARRILVRLPNWLGDALLARPMLHALRESGGGPARMAVAPAPLLELLGADGGFAATAAWSRDAAGRRAALAAARGFAPDVALVLPPSFSSAWFAWRSGAGVRIGYAHEGRAALLTCAPARPPRGDRHLSEEYLALARIAGAQDAAVPDLAVPAEARVAAHALRAAHPPLAAGPLAILGPGAAYGPAKQWGPDRFAALGRRLAARGSGIAVCGTAAEAESCAALAAAIGAAAVPLAGRTPLPVLAALCADASIAVCNDSGLAHLAAAAGAPTIAVFGSTSSAWTAPLGRRVRVLQHAPPCAPCFRRTCRIGYRCLAAVSVDAAEAACVELAA